MDKLYSDLLDHLLGMVYNTPVADRQHGRWVMSREWHNELGNRFGDDRWNPGFTTFYGYPVRTDGADCKFPRFVVSPELEEPAQNITINITVTGNAEAEYQRIADTVVSVLKRAAR